MVAAEQQDDRVRRPRVREPVPVRGDRRPPRRDRARGDREHRHRRPDDDPRGGEELRVRAPWSTRPESYDAVLQELERHGRAAVARHARVPRRRGVLLHGALRHRDRPLVRRAPGRLPDADDERLREGHRPLLRREPAPARGLLLAGRLAHARAVDGAPARRQGAVVQQRARPQRRPRCWSRSSSVPACAIIKHNNPCGAAVGGTARRGLRARLRVRPACRRSAAIVCLNRPVDARRRRARSSSSSARCLRAELHRGGARDPRRQAEHAHPRGQRAPPARHRRARPQARDGRPAGPGPRHRPRGPHGDGGRHRAQAERGRVGRDAVRLEGLQARALQRDRARLATSPRSASAPAR